MYKNYNYNFFRSTLHIEFSHHTENIPSIRMFFFNIWNVGSIFNRNTLYVPLFSHMETIFYILSIQNYNRLNTIINYHNIENEIETSPLNMRYDRKCTGTIS